jgi:hypothetical protein
MRRPCQHGFLIVLKVLWIIHRHKNPFGQSHSFSSHRAIRKKLPCRVPKMDQAKMDKDCGGMTIRSMHGGPLNFIIKEDSTN